MLTDPDSWHELMERLARTIARYLHAQFDAGANAVQVFDSWVGCLSPEHYKEFVLPHSRAAPDHRHQFLKVYAISYTNLRFLENQYLLTLLLKL